tara:strand:+ start:2629 stop:2796 length:168 start_codon:yes stop_codon:yes gene_type:complete
MTKLEVNVRILYDAEKLTLEEIQRDVDDIRIGGTRHGRVISATLEYKSKHYIELR